MQWPEAIATNINKKAIMSLLSNLKSDASIANERDSVGGYSVLDSDVYPSAIQLAYLTKSTGGAIGLVLQLKAENGSDIKSTLWMTNKQGSNTFTDKDGQKQYLPGFNLANSLSLLTVGKELSDLETEAKVVKVYSSEAKSEVNTKVDMLTELLGKDVLTGLIKQVVDKTKKVGDVYEPTGETREENEIDKFFRASDRKTTTEIRAKAEEAAFIDTWTAKWKGNVRNRAKGTAAAGVAGGRSANDASAKKPTTSLFG